ncbi:MAG: ABC transporter permease [Deltaproteobacteria bacterium]|jgi:ABC-2 type transport system permease protein|nr:ABC transporter permease [Deltaproteobacteria bacterium]
MKKGAKQMLRTLLALIRKESLQIFRDQSAVMIAFVLPLLLLFIFGYGVNLDNATINLGLVVKNSDAQSSSLISSFSNSTFFNVTIGRSTEEFKAPLSEGKLQGIAVIDEDFARALAGGKKTTLQLITDGSEPNSAIFVSAYSEGAFNTWLTHFQRDMGYVNLGPTIDIEPRYWYNQDLSSRNYLIPGSISIVMTLIGVNLTALVISREWERGTMEAMMATAVSMRQIILGKLVSYFILAMLSMVLSWAIAVYWYHVPFRGSMTALLIVSSVFVLSALGQGLLISTISKNQFLSAQLAIITGFLPSFMLSGFVFETASVPAALRAFSYLIPARYFVSCLQTLFLTGDVWSLFAESMLAMAAIGFVFFAVTTKMTVKRVA